MSMVLSTVSKAFRMCAGARSVRYLGFVPFRSSCLCCVNVVRSDVVVVVYPWRVFEESTACGQRDRIIIKCFGIFLIFKIMKSLCDSTY